MWASRNDFLSRISDPAPALRNRWINGRTTDELRVDLTERTEFSFLLMGRHFGEGDYSQYAVVPPLCRVADRCDAAFVFICGDVVYPVGNVNEYGDKFYDPYRTLAADRSMRYRGTMIGTTTCRPTCTTLAHPGLCRRLQASTQVMWACYLGRCNCGRAPDADFVRRCGRNQHR